MTRIFKTRPFHRWMRKTELSDAALVAAVTEMQQGLIDADLGGGVLKKRVALPGRGKRGGARVLLATDRKRRWLFVYGFQKNERDNIGDPILQELKLYAGRLLAASDDQMSQLTESGELEEVAYEN